MDVKLLQLQWTMLPLRKRMDVWRHGYGVDCEVDGVLYCYRRIAKK